MMFQLLSLTASLITKQSNFSPERKKSNIALAKSLMFGTKPYGDMAILLD